MRSDGGEFPAELLITRVRQWEQTILLVCLRDLTREKSAEQELRRYADGLRAVARRLVDAQEAERRALATELHNLVGQKLAALNINLNIVKSQSTPSTSVQSIARLEDSLKLVDETVESIRDVMMELRPAVLDDYGLLPVLRWYAEQFAKRTDVAATVVEHGRSLRLQAAAEEALFRIAQEAMANVIKHARARHVTLTLRTTSVVTSLIIADDGCGFDRSARPRTGKDHGLGLIIMRERAVAVGADMSIESAPARGTQVIVTLSHPAPGAGEHRAVSPS
jgi:signal transduction histidine kinase